MNLQLSEVVWIALFIILAGLWWRGQGVKAFALRKVKSYCDQNGLQLLDETLVIRKLWFSRSSSGFMSLRRTFMFEFTSTGEHRYRGTIVLLGYKVLSIDGDIYHLS